MMKDINVLVTTSLIV